MLLEAGADHEAKDKVGCGLDLTGTIARFRETPQPRADIVRNLLVFALRVVEGTAENCNEGDASTLRGVADLTEERPLRGTGSSVVGWMSLNGEGVPQLSHEHGHQHGRMDAKHEAVRGQGWRDLCEYVRGCARKLWVCYSVIR